eukprot:TRINITY_DN2684_c0_g1_i1.p1 TRINITY_DN2684_c0_g1~~TRINITY_DN2684_c0_g1_i1.p1  ORF type:complete len:392 (+),score=73.44 TRINITY_DN2684_c0_g1_i1:98-1273(+)
MVRFDNTVIVATPFMTVKDYLSPTAYYTKLDSTLTDVLDDARKRESGSGPTVVVFPENIGTWLVVVNESSWVDRPNMLLAMIWLIVKYCLSFFLRFLFAILIGDIFRYTLLGIVRRCIFKIKSNEMIEVYSSTFSKLAIKHGVWIVAGSINAPPFATDQDGSLIYDSNQSGKIFNQSVSFSPQGHVVGISKKIFLVKEEEEFLDAPPLQTSGEIKEKKNENMVFDSDLGRIGVLVCADSFYPRSYQLLQKQRAEIIVVASQVFGDAHEVPSGDKLIGAEKAWASKWWGYSPPTYTPKDVDANDIGKITEKDAWRKYSFQRSKLCKTAKVCAFSFFRGLMWDMISDGRSDVFSIEDPNLGRTVCRGEGKKNKDGKNPTERESDTWVIYDFPH